MTKTNTRLFSGINKPRDVNHASPDSFRFHVTMKAIWYMIVKFVNPPPQDWLDKLNGNNEVLRDIYYEYLEHEGQGRRREVLERAIPFLLCLMEDPNYAEFINWFFYRAIQEFQKGRFVFHPMQVYPRCWYRDDRPYRAIATRDEIMKLREEMKGHVKEIEVKP